MLRASSLLLLTALAVGSLGCPPPSPSPPAPGTAAPAPTGAPVAAWKVKSFAPATEGCKQTWACECAGFTAKAGCHIEGTKDESTTGVCAADSGPHAACARCMALPPAVACACKEVCP